MIQATMAVDPADTEAVRITGMLLRDPRGHRALTVLAEEQATLQEVVQILCAVLGPPQALDWRFVGHPEPRACLEMAGELEQLATRVAAASAASVRSDFPATVAASWPCGWEKLLSVALVGRPVPLQFSSMLRILGGEECSMRLNGFARLLRSASLVS